MAGKTDRINNVDNIFTSCQSFKLILNHR